jgi:hypothetical protein
MPLINTVYYGSTKIIAPELLTPYMLGTARTSSTDATVAVVSVAPSATAHTKGSWTEIIASTPADADIVTLIFNQTSLSGASGLALADIGVGAAASETVLVANVPVGSGPQTNGIWTTITLPVAVASGSRLSVRWQSARTSAGNANFGIALGDTPGVTSPTSLTNLNADTATSGGTDLGASNNTYVQITASTAAAYRGVVMGAMTANTTMSNSDQAFDLGVGGAGAETAYRGITYRCSLTEQMIQQYPWGGTYFAVDIPASTRLAARYINGANTNPNPHVVLFGVPV